MKITTITYGFEGSFGNYKHEKIFVTAALEEGESPDSVLKELRNWVLEQSNSKELYDELFNKLCNKRHELRGIEYDLKKAKEQWNQTAEFLRAQGIRPDAPDFPFTFPPALPQSQEPEEVDADLDDPERPF